jgi:hypothetical protein
VSSFSFGSAGFGSIEGGCFNHYTLPCKEYQSYKAIRVESVHPIFDQSLTIGQTVQYKEREDSFSDLNKDPSNLEKYAEKLLKKLSPKVHTLSG